MDERIFISYKRVNKEQVFALKKRIEDELGVKCWVDLDGIESSAQFASKICTAIGRCEVVLFMHSSAHLGIDYDNDWTVRELNYAHDEGKHVVLVRLDDAPLKNIFKMIYGTLNNIDSRNPDQWNILIRDLRKWLNLTTTTTSNQYSQQELEGLWRKGKEYYDAKQYEKAVELYRKAAEQGYSFAQEWLGYMYYIGYGVTKDHGESVRWFRKGAEQGNATAQNWLGYMYYYGYGVMKNYDEAVLWFRKAAEQGNARARYFLGHMYNKGEGVAKDLNEARRWLKKSADQGDEYAKDELEKL